MNKKRLFQRIDWAKVGVEMISVVFAVLLALLLNELRNNVKDNILLEKARRNLQEELRYNLDETKNKLSLHQSQLEELEQLADSLQVLDLPFYEYQVPVGILNLKDAAWQSITLTNVVNQLEFEELSTYSELYRGYEIIDKLQDNYIEEAFSMEFSRPENSNQAYLITRTHFYQMIAWEGELIEQIEGMLE